MEDEMAETLPWLIPCSILALYLVWAFAYDRHVQQTQSETDP